MLRRDQIVVPLLQQHGGCARNEFCFFETRRPPASVASVSLSPKAMPVYTFVRCLEWKLRESKKIVYNFFVAPRRCQTIKNERLSSSLDVRAHYGLGKIIIPWFGGFFPLVFTGRAQWNWKRASFLGKLSLGSGNTWSEVFYAQELQRALIDLHKISMHLKKLMWCII